MRFDRTPDPQGRAPSQPTPADRLVRRTSRSLALITLGLIAALLAGVGLVTGAVAINTTESAIDRTLEQAAAVRLAALEEQAARQPLESQAPSESTEPEETDESRETDEPRETDGPDDDDNSGPGSGNGGSGSGNSGSGSDDDDDDDRRSPAPSRRPGQSNEPVATPTASPEPTFGLPELDDRAPESADTFFMLLDSAGTVISNPQRISLAGLPERDAAVSASINGSDWRTIVAGGSRIRLLTQRILDGNGAVAGTLQSGFVLDLQDQQNNQILMTILLASLTGLLGAALITLFVTSRALGPIRAAFAAERRFVASASHELRTPVAVMRASAEILQREDLVKPDGRKLVEDIIGESDRLARLVSDLLALASAEAGAITVHPQPIELRSFVTDLARRAEAIAAEKGVRVEVVQQGLDRAVDNELVVSADPDRMAQLLLIFIDNAIDHSPAGGTVRLVVGPVNEGGKQRVSVGVADEGPGVPHAERARIFEPFARLAGRRRETGNTGLGLAIARILAARQQATLHVEDAAGGGAVFSVWLPRRPGSESPANV